MLGVTWAALGGAVRAPYDQAIPIVRTFIRKLDPDQFTEQLLDDLQVRLATRAIVGGLELPEAIPVLFFDEPRVETSTPRWSRRSTRSIGRPGGNPASGRPTSALWPRGRRLATTPTPTVTRPTRRYSSRRRRGTTLSGRRSGAEMSFPHRFPGNGPGPPRHRRYHRYISIEQGDNALAYQMARATVASSPARRGEGVSGDT